MGTLVYDKRLLRQLSGVDPVGAPTPSTDGVPFAGGTWYPAPEFVTASEISKQADFPENDGMSERVRYAEAKPTCQDSVLQEADSVVNGERQASYGHPFFNFRDIASFWTTYLRGKYGDRFDLVLAAEDIGSLMILMKVSREMHEHKRDNLVDIAGYAETISKVINYRDDS